MGGESKKHGRPLKKRWKIIKEAEMKIEDLAAVLKKMMDDEYQRGYNSGLFQRTKRALKLVKTDTGIDIERRRAETQ